MTVLRDHAAIREGGLRYCTCNPARGARMAPAEHTYHLAEQIALASQLGAPSGPDAYLLPASELTAEHVGLYATLPVPGLGDLHGTVTALAPWQPPGQPDTWVELTVQPATGGPARAYAVKPTTWVTLTTA